MASESVQPFFLHDVAIDTKNKNATNRFDREIVMKQMYKELSRFDSLANGNGYRLKLN
jgi:hypothetical protein